MDRDLGNIAVYKWLRLLLHVEPFFVPVPHRGAQWHVQVLRRHPIPELDVHPTGDLGSSRTSFLLELKEMVEQIEVGEDPQERLVERDEQAHRKNRIGMEIAGPHPIVRAELAQEWMAWVAKPTKIKILKYYYFTRTGFQITLTSRHSPPSNGGHQEHAYLHQPCHAFLCAGRLHPFHRHQLRPCLPLPARHLLLLRLQHATIGCGDTGMMWWKKRAVSVAVAGGRI